MDESLAGPEISEVAYVLDEDAEEIIDVSPTDDNDDDNDNDGAGNDQDDDNDDDYDNDAGA